MTRSVVFLGTSAFAIPALEKLAADPAFTVELVITQPDRPAGRKQTLAPPPVKTVAEKLGLKVWQPESLNKEAAYFPLSTFHFLVVISYGQILSQEILNLPTIAAVNVHASLLPKLRGASPLQHTILSGEKEGGVTVQKMVKELDAGPVLAQQSHTLDPRETFSSLHDKLAIAGAKLLVETLKQPLKPVDQDVSKATFCGKLKKSDGDIDPTTMTAEEIDRKVRALTPWPGVTWKGNKILETALEASPNSAPLLCAKNTTLHIVRMQPSGGTPMDGSSFRRGHPGLFA